MKLSDSTVVALLGVAFSLIGAVLALQVPSWYAPLVIFVCFWLYETLSDLYYLATSLDTSYFKTPEQIVSAVKNMILEGNVKVSYSFIMDYHRSPKAMNPLLKTRMPEFYTEVYEFQRAGIHYAWLGMFLFNGKRRFAIRVKKKGFDGMYLHLVYPMALLLGIAGGEGIPWDFWTGLYPISNSLLELTVLTVAVLGFKDVFGYIFRSYTPQKWTSIQTFIAKLFYAPFNEEAGYGWILTMFCTLTLMAWGVNPFLAYAVGTVVSVLYFTPNHNPSRRFDYIALVYYRIMLNIALLFFGYPVAVVLHALINGWSTIPGLLPPRK